MTNGNSREEMLKWMNIVERGSKVSQGLDSLIGSERVGAESERDRYSREGLLTDPFGMNDQPFYDEAGWNAKPENEKREELRGYLGIRKERSLQKACDVLYSNPNGVLKEGDRFSSKLEALAFQIASNKDTARFIDGKYGEILNLYIRYKGVDLLSEKMERGEALSEEEAKEIGGYADYLTEQKAAEYAEFLRTKHGIEGELAKGLTGIAARAYRPNREDLKKFVKDVLKKQAEDALKVKAGNRDYKEIIADVAGDALGKMIRSGNRDYQSLAVGYAYAALKDSTV